MPAAIAIPAIIGAASAGASLAGAKMGSNAAHSAAQLQSQSADKAQAFNQQAWQAQQRALAPYQQAGQQSLQALMQRQYGGPSLEQRANSYVSAAQNGGGLRGPADGVKPGQFNQPQQSLGAMAQGSPAGATMPYQGPVGGPQTVMMVGPDGTQKAVPIAQVQEATRRGAKMVQ